MELAARQLQYQTELQGPEFRVAGALSSSICSQQAAMRPPQSIVLGWYCHRRCLG